METETAGLEAATDETVVMESETSGGGQDKETAENAANGQQAPQETFESLSTLKRGNRKT